MSQRAHTPSSSSHSCLRPRLGSYNGAYGGPTIRIKPGDTLTVAFTNNLAAELHDTSGIHNQFRDFDRTNLHTHGLHVSSASPGDDIFIEVGPGETFPYSYSIPTNHMGGTVRDQRSVSRPCIRAVSARCLCTLPLLRCRASISRAGSSGITLTIMAPPTCMQVEARPE